jgi:tetratricopeptide (TPR) repeat protein
VSNDYHREALKALDRLADGNPKLPWTYYYRIIFRRAVATRNLVEDADARLREDEDTVERLAGKRYGWMLMASAQKKMYAGELPAALKLLQSVIDSTDPPNWLAQCMAGETLACMGKKAEAFKAFDRAAQIAPEFEKGNILAWRGEMHLWLGEYPLAIEALDEALRRTAQYAHCWKGGALVASGRPLEALPVLERAIAISPWDLEAKAWRGEALHRLGRHREALEQLSFPPGETKSANGYWHVLRGLIRKALGDSAGLREEVGVLSSTLFSKRPDWRQVLGPASLDSDDEIVKALEGILSRSRGLRRGSIHERMLWMP